MELLKRVRPMDYLLTGALVVIAMLIGLENVNAKSADDVAHVIESHSTWIIPVFVLAVLPVLLRRSAIVAAIWASAAVVGASVLMFGWIVRCGFGLPLSFVLAYSLGRFAKNRSELGAGLLGLVALQVAVLIRDSATDGAGIMVATVPIAIVLTAVGLFVHNRTRTVAAPVQPQAERVHA